MGRSTVSPCGFVGIGLTVVTLNCVCLLATGLTGAAETHQALMPRASDYTHMWWAEGFPGHTPAAPWLRCIQTGHFAMVLDTQNLRIPHLGTVPAGRDYLQCARADNADWRQLPPAQLDLTITADGTVYRATAGGEWSDFRGPRLIESGRFVQRADVTDLVFTADDGHRLNVDSRLETVAWPDRLALILAARPAYAPIPAGEVCFGRVGGGYGLDGTNHLEFPHAADLDPEQFTLEFWVFAPADYQVSPRTPPWLACKNLNEEAEGNYGICLLGTTVRAVLNIGGGRDNQFFVDARRDAALQLEAWNHLAMSYDGDTLRLFLNGQLAGERAVGRRRVPGREGLAFGRRQDNCGDGYYFRGVIDEIRLFDRAVPPDELRQRARDPAREATGVKPVRAWSFRADGQAAAAQPRTSWRTASMAIRLRTAEDSYEATSALQLDNVPPEAQPPESSVYVVLQPGTRQTAASSPPVIVEAREFAQGLPLPVSHDAARGWHRVDLNGIEPMVPPGEPARQNDAVERITLVLTNPADDEQVARLRFEKEGSGFRHRFGSPITGMSAVLRDAAGHPVGIPVQLSKNWHTRREGGTYAGTWFHGFSQVHLPPHARVELELVVAYGHWGGVAAASHAQLCLIGWGSNQLWDQSALGAWGESICYEPDQAQAHAGVLDVRPLMVRSMDRGAPWSWTHNVGGADFFRAFDIAGHRVFPARMRTAYLRQGPCLTEVTYAGHTGPALEHSATVSLYRSDDLVRGVYRLRLDVHEPCEFSRLVVFQVGADTYGYTAERKMAVGDETGLLREWTTQWGSGRYRTEPFECTGRLPWVSLHEAISRAPPEQDGAWANRGIVIRSWDARLGGSPARPWVAERGVHASGADTSTIDVLPPPGVTRLEPGDYVEAVVEHVVMPQFAADYYGPNDQLRAALGQWQDTWRMIHREALGNDLQVHATVGEVAGLRPAVRVRAREDRAELTLTGGVGYVPVTFTHLTAPCTYELRVNGQLVNQSTHGNDYWQTDYDPGSGTWELTFTIPAGDGSAKHVRFKRVAAD
ncbi:MAG: LamG domain-containing protein [Pirellulaceae bacterium]|nr:LamG domain-containing protein [Pirellulaceae bacterium]